MEPNDKSAAKTELTEEVKARVPVAMKTEIERIATGRLLSASDVVREALQIYLRESQEKPGEVAA